MKKFESANLKLVAKDNMKKGIFAIYLDYSGKREYIMSHRYNAAIYNILVEGISLSELYRSKRKIVSSISMPGHRYSKGDIHPRLKCKKNQSRKLENSLEHILSVANEYLKYELVA